MKITLEAECAPLFVVGVLLVLLIELLFMMILLRKHPGTRRMMLAHVVCLLIAFFCLGFILFVSRPTPDGDVQNSSLLLGTFGVFWLLGELSALGAVCGLLTGKRTSKKAEESRQKAAADAAEKL